MTLVAQLEAARDAASQLAAEGEQVVAVLAAEPGSDALVFVCAYEGAGELSYLGLDTTHQPVTDLRLVREAVTVVALAERAEEVSTATSGDELRDGFARVAQALRAAGREQEAASAEAVVARLDELAGVVEGPRVASPGYLDRVAASAGNLGAAADGYAVVAQNLADQVGSGEVDQQLAAQAWAALAALSRAGDPGGLPRAMTGTSGSVEALVDDVVERYRVPLV
jgi:MoxR-like ATPase